MRRVTVNSCGCCRLLILVECLGRGDGGIAWTYLELDIISADGCRNVAVEDGPYLWMI